MKERHAELFLLAGLWVSFIAVSMAGTMLLPPSKELAEGSPALLYKVARSEELRRPESIPAEGSVLVADLDDMKLSLYRDNTLVKTFPILSRGMPGTFWETPTGKYAIAMKEPKHFSSIGGTWMPYSMQFYGNFFIHGWPTYPDGKPVAKGYSGGCIRLDTDDAREVYDFASVGTRLFVRGGTPKSLFATSSAYYLRGGGMLPAVSARSFVVADVDTGDILWERDADTPIAPGALVALPTALSALETVNQYQRVRVGELLIGNSPPQKQPSVISDELPIGTLIYPLLFDLNDIAGKVFSRTHGVKRFVGYMNEKARAIGMEQTIFGGTLSGDRSTTTARDLLTLLRYVDRHKHFLIAATLAKDHSVVASDGYLAYRWQNKNPWLLSGDGRYRGGLSDVHADGGGSALLLFTLPVSEFGDRTVAFVVHDSPDLESDIAQLRAFVTDHYVYGIERSSAFVREGNDPATPLLKRALELFNLQKLLQGEVAYEREV